MRNRICMNLKSRFNYGQESASNQKHALQFESKVQNFYGITLYKLTNLSQLRMTRKINELELISAASFSLDISQITVV